MEFILEENCYDFNNIDIANSNIKSFLGSLIRQENIVSLDYFIVADSSNDKFKETVMQYADIVGTEANITQHGDYSAEGKSLCGLGKDGILHQAVVIKSWIWMLAECEYMRSQGQLPDEILKQMSLDNRALSLIIHEIGHVLDNENQYKMSRTINTKIKYDLPREYDEYVTQMALSLWGEYYAESFSNQVISLKEYSTLEQETNLINCIKGYCLEPKIGAALERAYRILYYFVIRLAFIHQHNNEGYFFDYENFEQMEFVSDYIQLLKRAEIAIIDLQRDYPNWSTYDCLTELSLIIKDFIYFEIKK